MIEYIYTPLADAIRELESRKKNTDLKNKVINFFGKDMPYSLDMEKNSSYFSRYIATPNTELRYFIDLSQTGELNPIFLEYKDKFVAKNPDKYHLCKLYTYHKNKKGAYETFTKKIVDFNLNEGKNLSAIKTLNNTPLVDFHHDFLKNEKLNHNLEIIDITDWFNETRNKSENYYLYFLSLFVYHGILFENYWLEDKEESGFIEKKILPSIKEVERIFGVKPLIVPLLPIEVQKHDYWLSYPESASLYISNLDI